MKKIFVGADHGGFHLKQILLSFLKEKGYEVEDCGAYAFDPGDDYPEFCFTVGEKVQADPESHGILICRSGGGAAIAANKVTGIRAVVAMDEETAHHAKEHNDAQVLVLGADFVSSEEKAKKLTLAFLQAEFHQEARHQRRIHQISAYEQGKT